jgi:hypothetical protein
MNTWLTEIITNANERTFNDREMERMLVYYNSLPARLRAAEEVEQLEVELTGTLHAELRKKHPRRTLYTKRVVQDLLEGLRHLAHAAVADEPRLFRRRWVAHLKRLVEDLPLDPGEVRDVYVTIAERLERKLSAASYECLQPFLEELLDALTGPQAVSA